MRHIPAKSLDDQPYGEVALWRAVIRQALNDSTLSDDDAREFDRLKLPKIISRERALWLEQARTWFLDRDDDDFDLVCELAGLSAPEVQRWALDEIRHFDRVAGDWKTSLGAMWT